MRAAVVNENNEVVNVIVADPAVDSVPGFTLRAVPDGQACDKRYVWNGESFVPNAEYQAELDAEAAALQAAIEAEAWETVP